MDTTHPPESGAPEIEEIDALTARLESADPAEAPPLAEEIAERLGGLLDGDGRDGDGSRRTS